MLRELVKGRTSKQIALVLGLSYHTVRRHRENLMRKLGLRNVAELTWFELQPEPAAFVHPPAA